LKLNALSTRLIAAAAVWTMLGLAVGGVVLSAAFRSAAQNSFDSALSADMDGVIAAAEPDSQGGVVLQQRFLSHRFDRVYSGLYYQIVPLQAGGPGTQISRSLFDKTITLQNGTHKGPALWGYAAGPSGQHLRVLARRIEFPVAATADPGDVRAYRLYVAGDLAEVDAQAAEFDGTLIWSFVILGLGLVAAIFLQVRIGLQPLRKLREALARIRAGKARRLEGSFPAEIAPLAAELNSLIAHDEEVVGRARTHVSNLAHSLKTPLSVLSGEAQAQAGPLADTVRRQVAAMRRQVDHYLARARASGALDVLGSRTPVHKVLSDLARVLMRIHEARAIRIAFDCPPDLFFRGERQDLEEMVGNLMDNACKWAAAQVTVTAARRGAVLTLTVEDDGPGLSPQERTQVGMRGERLDESVPGSGLGLAIVGDIAKLYAGSLELGASPLGGLQARLTLPAIS
jgi:signal transduction histidine kinase